MSDEVSAIHAINRLEECFSQGQIVEVIEGNPRRCYALVRLTRDADHLVPVNIGAMTPADYQSLLAWHENKWAEMMKNKSFARWAARHPIPEPKPIK